MRLMLIGVLLLCASCGEKIDPADKANVVSYLEETETDLKQNFDMAKSMCEGSLKGGDVSSRIGDMNTTLKSRRESDLFGKLMQSSLPDRFKEKVDQLSMLRSSAGLTWSNIMMARVQNQPDEEARICSSLAKVDSDVRAAMDELRAEIGKP